MNILFDKFEQYDYKFSFQFSLWVLRIAYSVCVSVSLLVEFRLNDWSFSPVMVQIFVFNSPSVFSAPAGCCCL